MTIVERLQAIAKEKGTNFKQIERICGIGNGTMRRWDTQAPRLDKITAVADYLQVSIDYLVRGSSSNATTNEVCDGVPLSYEESDFVAMYRLLPDEQRREAFDYIYFKYKRTVELGKESIYSTYFEDDLTPSDPGEGGNARTGTA